MTTILADERPVARCRHLCDICGGIIPPGHQYHRQRGVWDGEPYTYKGHLLCTSASSWVRRDLDLLPDESADPDEVVPVVRRVFENLSLFGSARFARPNEGATDG